MNEFSSVLSAAKKGDAAAMCKLAEIYRDGSHGEKQDSQKAIFWYEQAAEYNHTFAMLDAALLYIDGAGMEPNAEKAVFWLEKAIEKGNIGAMYFLGKIYRDGKGGLKKDLEKAIALFEKAAENGSKEAIACLSKAYFLGQGVEKNYQKAVDYCINYWGNLRSSYCENLMAKIRINDEAIDYFEKAEQAGSKEATIALAYIYRYGQREYGDLNNNIDSYKAFCRFKKLAEEGDAAAMFELGDMYEFWSDAIPCNREERGENALVWYKKAAKLGHKSAIRKVKCISEQKTLRREIKREQKTGDLEKDLKNRTSGLLDGLAVMAECYAEIQDSMEKLTEEISL
jgi:TPR repeat protein